MVTKKTSYFFKNNQDTSHEKEYYRHALMVLTLSDDHAGYDEDRQLEEKEVQL